MKPPKQLLAADWIAKITEPVKQEQMRAKELELRRKEAGPLRVPLEYPWNQR